MPGWSAAYVGLPWRENGWNRDGLCCWGLVRLVLRERFGVDLPAHDSGPVAGVGRRAPAFARDHGFAPVLRRRRPGDVVHMLTLLGGKRAPLHCGVAVDARRVLHVERHTGAVVVDLGARLHAWRDLGAWRPT